MLPSSTITLKIVGVTWTLGSIRYINADFLKWMDGMLMRNEWRRLVLTGLAGAIFNPALPRPSVDVAPRDMITMTIHSIHPKTQHNYMPFCSCTSACESLSLSLNLSFSLASACYFAQLFSIKNELVLKFTVCHS